MKRIVLSVAVYILCCSVLLVAQQKNEDVKLLPVAGQIYVVQGNGGNIGILTDPSGVLMIDAMYSASANSVRQSIKSLPGGNKIRFLVNTHWHGDHTDGNKVFGKEALIIAHENVRPLLQKPQTLLGQTVPALPSYAVPSLTYSNTLNLYIGDETIRLVHYPHAHTNGDTVVYFEKSNVMHMGDMFFNGLFPFMDVDNGGDIENWVRQLDVIIAKAPADVKIIPGHGSVTGLSMLKDFRQMLHDSAEIVNQAMKEGKTLDQIKAAGLPESFNPWTKGFLTTPQWLELVYRSLKKNAVPVQTSLKDAFKNHFRIGAAVNTGQVIGTDIVGTELVKQHFNSITPENDMKWERIHPRPDPGLAGYDFKNTDAYVEFGVKNGMFIIGHCLVWHSQTPRWVFQDSEGKPLTREALLQRMSDHIHTVVGRYKGRVNGWDVVNEALNEDGTLRKSPWLNIIGDDYIAKAFQYANEADPEAELYYNDYNLEYEAKRKGAVELVKNLQQQGIRITAIGTQSHDKMDRPTAQQHDETFKSFKELGIKVAVTELDVDVLPAVTRQPTADVSVRAQTTADSNPYTAGLPDEMQKKLAERYAELFAVFAKYNDVITRVTFWGVTDKLSWLNNFPAMGRTNYPLLFDRDGKTKPAFIAVVNTVK
jgi:endo-1,4-beta-xylanase